MSIRKGHDEDDPDLQLIVSHQELAKFASSKEADHLQRLEADTQLMLRLAAEGFEGRAWKMISQALVEYGFTVVKAWVETDHMSRKCREKGYFVPDLRNIPGGAPRRHEVEELVQDTVADAIIRTEY